MLNKSLAVGIVFLFIVSSTIPMVLGNDVESEIQTQATALSDGPMDSPWPTKCQNNRHTGLSPYSTADNPGIEKWRFRCARITDGIVIGDDGTLYFGDYSWEIYAINPDGTLKWTYHTGGAITSSPAIAEDGTIYVGSWDDYLYALYPNNGTLKWKKRSGGTIASSPVIANDGTIYVGTMRDFIYGDIVAFYPNGTKRWTYKTGEAVISDPAIGDDGTIYVGSYDYYLYAIYPNGTLRWRFKTGGYVRSPPSIADDGTIYFGSYDHYLYALNPDGTLKWKIGGGASASLSIGSDGTIYGGSSKLYAIYPNGTIKWGFILGPAGSSVGFSCPAISAEGTIYVGANIGYDDGGYILALFPDGTEKWRKIFSLTRDCQSSPCIGEDGTVYIGSDVAQGRGYLHAFGSVESNEPPGAPTIGGPTWTRTGIRLWNTFSTVDPDNNPVSFYIDWGDDTNTGWTTERASGEKCYYEHTWSKKGNYIIKAKVKDVMGEESDWGYYEVEIVKPRLAFLHGEIYDYVYIDGWDDIKFKAENLIVIQLFPPSLNRYTSGEQIYVTWRNRQLTSKSASGLYPVYYPPTVTSS